MRYVGIDPSTKTGFVALDQNGEVLKSKELKGITDKDPKRMVSLIHEILSHIRPGDFICIEGFPFSTQRAMFAGGIHHGIRNELYKVGMTYTDIPPNQVKKYVGVTGWIGEKGNKTRLKGAAKKKAVMDSVFELYGIKFNNDNICDAFILAKIAESLKTGKTLTEKQQEIIQSLDPIGVS